MCFFSLCVKKHSMKQTVLMSFTKYIFLNNYFKLNVIQHLFFMLINQTHLTCTKKEKLFSREIVSISL